MLLLTLLCMHVLVGSQPHTASGHPLQDVLPTANSQNDTTTATLMETTTAPFPTGTCNSATCQLPDCYCLGTAIPNNMDLNDVPQMVLLTFDDAITDVNVGFYRQLFPDDSGAALRNPNDCRTTATFFINDIPEVDKIKEVADKGNEIGSHSMSHTEPSFWTPEEWELEMQGERMVLAEALEVPLEKIGGMRTPFLSLGGDPQYTMMQNDEFIYDSSIYEGSLDPLDKNDPIWPYTLKYPPRPMQTECDAAGCPTRSYPGLWEIPMIRQYLDNPFLGAPSCSMTDSCVTSSTATKDDVLEFLRSNFNRFYTTNRAPFMISLHATWFDIVPASFEALQEFLGELTANKDVYQITLSQMLDWMRDPKPKDQVQEIPSWKFREGC